MLHFISLVRARFRVLPLMLQRVFLWATLLNFSWIVGTLWVFSRGTSQRLSLLQLDKMMHFGGGICIAGLVTVLGLGTTRRHYLVWVFVVGVLWEIWEVAFLQDQQTLFSLYYWAWFSDTMLDLAADVLGAYRWSNLLLSTRVKKTA